MQMSKVVLTLYLATFNPTLCLENLGSDHPENSV